MNKSDPLSLSQELLDDFFTEADEHLLNIRRLLGGLEGAACAAPVDFKLIGDLFHNFHSFKGISAMAGLESAEALAHAAEDLLRLIRNGQMAAGGKTLNILGEATRKLEQIVAAFRGHKRFPDCESLLTEIKQQSSPETAAPDKNVSAPAPGEDDIKKARQRGLQIWKYTFTPTHELNARQININTIRERIFREGEVLRTTPVIKGKGLVTFELLVAAAKPPEDSQDWHARGVTIELVEDQGTLSAPAPGSDMPNDGDQADNPFLAPSHIVRVDIKRLDELLRLVGEMVIHRSRLDIELARLGAKDKALNLSGVQEVNRMLGRSLRQMREDIMRTRLIPIAEIFTRLPFVVRDLSRQMSKKVRLKMEGQETAIDKFLIEKLKDPLLHMVRNALSHGIETTAERAASSKSPEATIELKASTSGDSIIIKIRDDGKGINASAIIQRAKELGLETPRTADPDEILKILCSPGFSTRNEADRTSGRGVGMSVVQATVNELRGKLALESEEGKGTQFTLRLPLNVVIAETVLVTAAGQTCAVPQSSVAGIFNTSEGDIQLADGIEMVAYRGGVLPVTRLARFFHLKDGLQPIKSVLVITSERGSIGLLVEKVLEQREVVVRSFRDPLVQVPGVSGATELGDGKPVLILDGVALTAGNVRPHDNLNPGGEHEFIWKRH